MKALVPMLGAALGVAALASFTPAQPPPYLPGYPPGYRPAAPDACGPGAYCTNCWGMTYGPNHNVYPCGRPFNGLLPLPERPKPPSCGCPTVDIHGQPVPCFPTHPYARGPRDYFMLENWPKPAY